MKEEEAHIMDLHISQHNGIAVMALSGRFDAYGAPQLEKGIKQTIEQGTAHIIVDLADVHLLHWPGNTGTRHETLPRTSR